MKRRTVFSLLTAGSTAAFPIISRAQKAQGLPLIAWLSGGALANGTRLFGIVKDGLRELDRREGRDFVTVAHASEGVPERLSSLARETVRLDPAIIVAGAVDAVVQLRKVTTTIPIVSAFLADAAHLGLVASNARPGGNVTGIEPYVEKLPSKQLELALELVPGAKKIGILGNLNDPKAPPQQREIEEAARGRGLSVIAPEVVTSGDFDGAMQTLAGERVDVLIVLQTTVTLGWRQRIAALSLEKRLPTVHGYSEHVDEGGLISYGVSTRWCCNRLATFVYKILNGAKPGDLPVEFPPRLEMVVNLKTAKALNVMLPSSIVLRADRAVE